MEKIAPLISIIVPNYNHANYLVERLVSIFNQTYDNFEVILLDDCSTDNSRAILLEYAKDPKVSHCVFNEINSGNTFVQWNKGISLAKGEYIWVAESDDFCELNFLEELIKPLIEDKDIVLSYCQSNRVDENGIVTGTWLNHTDDLDSELFKNNFCMDGNEFVEKFLIYKNVIPNASGVLFKRMRAIEIGSLNLNPKLKYNGDWTFYINLIMNKKIIFVPDSFNNYRHHSQSVIAKASQNKSVVLLKDILLYTRKIINCIIKKESPVNNRALIALNNNVTKKIIYEKASFYIHNKQKIKGYFILLSILGFILKKKRSRLGIKKDFIIK